MTILGDAVRVGPGFGANMAMQDACRLRDALVRVAAGQDDLVEALRTATPQTEPTRQLVGTAESGA